MKRILSLVLVLVLVLGTMTTAFAGNLDLINTVDSNKSYSYSEIVQSPVKFGHVGTNPENYLIEFNTKFYKLTDLIAATAGGDSIEDAVAGLTPVTPEEPEELTVVSVSAINATTLLVIMSDGTPHPVVLELGQKLTANKKTHVTFEVNGKYEAADVIWTPGSAELEEQILEAQIVLNNAIIEADNAAQELVQALLNQDQANKYGTEEQKLAAEEAVEIAMIKAEYTAYRLFVAGQNLYVLVYDSNEALAYEKAVLAVIKAEKTNDKVDYEYAKSLVVGDLEDSDAKKALEDRLDYVKQIIDAVEGVSELEEFVAVEGFNLPQAQNGYAHNLGLVEALEEGDIQADLLARLEAVKVIIDARVKAWLENEATVAVDNAQSALDLDLANPQDYHDLAFDLVDALEDENVKAALLLRLEAIQEAIDEKVKEANELEATNAVDNAESAINFADAQDFHDLAFDLVDALEDEDVKAALLLRLVAVQDYIDVVQMIVDLPNAGAVTLADKVEVDEAKAAFDLLSLERQALVPNKTKLNNVLARIVVLEEIKAAQDLLDSYEITTIVQKTGPNPVILLPNVATGFIWEVDTPDVNLTLSSQNEAVVGRSVTDAVKTLNLYINVGGTTLSRTWTVNIPMGPGNLAVTVTPN